MDEITVSYFKQERRPGRMCVGVAPCPVCKQEVTIANDDGFEGLRSYDYFSNHGPAGKLCPTSERYIVDVVKGDLKEHCLPLC